MWSEYYTGKGCEVEVKCKGHLTRPQEAVHVENVKNDFNFEKFKISVLALNLPTGSMFGNICFVHIVSHTHPSIPPA